MKGNPNYCMNHGIYHTGTCSKCEGQKAKLYTPDRLTSQADGVSHIMERPERSVFSDKTPLPVPVAPKGVKMFEEIQNTSARFNSGKTQVRELDPAFIMGLGEVLTAARSKYEEGNWMKPTKFSTPYESAMRHLMKFWDGTELDEETGKHHLLHAATNLMFLYYHSQNGEEGSDDRLFKKKKK